MGKLKPALHFILLGALAFLLIGRESARDEIFLSSQELVTIKERWERTNRVKASPEVLKHLLDETIYSEILLREALKLHFHQTDRVVWRRLIQNMSFASPEASMDDEELFKQGLSLYMHLSDLIVRRRLIARMERFIKNSYAIDEPVDSDIDRFIQDNPDLFAKGERVSFCHVFLSSDGMHDGAEGTSEGLLRQLREENLPPEKAYRLGNMFPHPYCFHNVSRSYVNNMFGKGFADDLLACKASVWSGPFQSGYGTHLVRLENKSATGVLNLHENRNRARNLLTVEREKQLLQDIVTELGRKYYTVLIDCVPAGSFRLEQLLNTQVPIENARRTRAVQKGPNTNRTIPGE